MYVRLTICQHYMQGLPWTRDWQKCENFHKFYACVLFKCTNIWSVFFLSTRTCLSTVVVDLYVRKNGKTLHAVNNAKVCLEFEHLENLTKVKMVHSSCVQVVGCFTNKNGNFKHLFLRNYLN